MSDIVTNYPEMYEASMGYCPNCDDWTRDATEPDAEHYDCPECGLDSVVGADIALIVFSEY